MKQILTAVAAAALLALAPNMVSAKGGHNSNYCYSCVRDSSGHIRRSPEARVEFEQRTGYPHGRPGYVIDHIVPLKRGGADAPWNMQWQTKEAAKAKDKWE